MKIGEKKIVIINNINLKLRKEAEGYSLCVPTTLAYYFINDTGFQILIALSNNKHIDDIIDTFISSYGIDRAFWNDVVKKFLYFLQNINIINYKDLL